MSNNGAASQFPNVEPSSDHAVLYQIPAKHASDVSPQPHKILQEDRWDDYHVRMPHSIYNQYEKSIRGMKTTTESRWGVIEKALSEDINNSDDLTKAILKYNGKFKDVWKFQALHVYLHQHLNKRERKDFFQNILPGIIKLALMLPGLIQTPLPLLKQHQNQSISLSQQQIASLLANAFLCTFPWRNTAYQNTMNAKLPKINFTLLYERYDEGVFQKLRCICNYFKRVVSEPPTGMVTFSRRFVPRFFCPDWEYSPDLIRDVPVNVDSELSIEDAKGQIQVDFANKFLGGGVLGSGLVQEEIRFLICPELMASMIFTESLTDQEALMIIGCERYNKYTGYGRESFQWAGDYRDHTPFDSSRRRRCAVLAIDAVPYWHQRHQFNTQMILRELNKAWIGFTFFQDNSETLQYPAVATGNWGCGAFNGAPQLKCLIQMMAAAAAKRPLSYYTFGDQHHAKEVETVYELCEQHSVTVGELFKGLMEYDCTKTDLHSFLKEKLEDKLKKYRNRDTAEDKTYENKMDESEKRHAQTQELYAQIAGSYKGYDRRHVDTQKGKIENQRYNKDSTQYNEKCVKTICNYTEEPKRTYNSQCSQNYAKKRGRGSDYSQKYQKYSGPSQNKCPDYQRSNYDTNQTLSNLMPDPDPTSYEYKKKCDKTSSNYIEESTKSCGQHSQNYAKGIGRGSDHSQKDRKCSGPSQNKCPDYQRSNYDTNQTLSNLMPDPDPTSYEYKKKCDKTSSNYIEESTKSCGQHSQNYAKGIGRGSDHSQKDRKYSGPSQNKCPDYQRSNYDTNQTLSNLMPDPDPTSYEYKKKCDKTSSNYIEESTKSCGQHSQNYAKGIGRGSDHSQKDRKYSGPPQNNRLDYPRWNYDLSTNQTPRNLMSDSDPTQKWSTRNGNEKNNSDNMHGIFGTAPPPTCTVAEGCLKPTMTTVEWKNGSILVTKQSVSITQNAELMDWSSVNDLEKKDKRDLQVTEGIYGLWGRTMRVLRALAQMNPIKMYYKKFT